MYFVCILSEAEQIYVYSRKQYNDLESHIENLLTIYTSTFNLDTAKSVANELGEKYNYTVYIKL